LVAEKQEQFTAAVDDDPYGIGPLTPDPVRSRQTGQSPGGQSPDGQPPEAERPSDRRASKESIGTVPSHASRSEIPALLLSEQFQHLFRRNRLQKLAAKRVAVHQAADPAQ